LPSDERRVILGGPDRRRSPRMKCPICKIASAPRAQNKAYPFCSDRCRLVDLGRWMSEDYTISEPLWTDPEAAESGAGLEDAGGARTNEDTEDKLH
jgi:endogenous inhibitor of DNA gyrase (YacG/DUF329 family)